MHILSVLLIILSALALSGCLGKEEKTTPSTVVTTTAGRVQGIETQDPGIALYAGLPFAAPPVGDLRWAPPATVTPWQNVRDASKFGPECMQYRKGLAAFMKRITKGLGLSWSKQQLAGLSAGMAEKPNQSEDCLYLNVRTDNVGNPAQKPVMVWIHGGSHQTGAGSSDMYQSNTLIKNGVVLVTINYRLGPLGYMAHPALTAASPNNSSGNYGLLDQIAALEWVRDNIAAFGGDPENITLFGESAGAQSVTEVMASPLSKGLFHKIILQSGASTGNVLHLSKAVTVKGIEKVYSGHEIGVLFTEGLTPSDRETTAADLRAIPVADLIERTGTRGHLAGYFLPVIDGRALPKQIGATVADGEMPRVPMLAGFNADEGTLFYTGSPTRLDWSFPETYEARIARIEELYGKERATTLTALYGLGDPATYDKGATDMLGDDVFGVHMRFLAKQRHREEQSNYMYMFSRLPPSKKQTIGAFHASEIAFVFNAHSSFLKTSKEDHQLTEYMGKYWANFATTGNPNASGLPNWPEYDPAQENYLELNHKISVLTGLRKEKLDVLETMLLENIEASREIAIID